MKLSEVFNVYTKNDVDLFLVKYTNLTLNELNLSEDKIKKHFRYVGEMQTNASTIDLLSDSGKGLIERITNGIDAVREKTKIKHNSKANLEKIMQEGFPRFDSYRKSIIKSKGNNDLSLKALDADNQVKVMIHDGSSGFYPTIDIIDNGTGIDGENFATTILSIHGGNKINVEKNYLIGSFGQGGSTSLSFAEATIIISKHNSKIYFTLVKRVQIRNMKSHVYCYLVNENGIPFKVLNDINISDNQHINDFLNSDSGTLVRMIDVQLEKKLRGSDVTKPTGLIDYINTELYDVKMPIKLIDNRERFKLSQGYQNRNAMGSQMKLLTTSFVRREYSGTYEIPFEGCYIDVDYFVILPANEEDWGKDSICKTKYLEFNTHDKPVFYTVNGQYITGEGYTKLNNGGLNFLKHRIMVNINLDKLGKAKYKFFTTDRSRIKKLDSSAQLYDNVIDRLVKDEKLIEINEIIAQKAISSEIDESILDEVKNSVINEYREFLKGEGVKRHRKKGTRVIHNERELFHYIDSLNIPTNRNAFYRNEQVNIKLTTNAYKNVNMDAQIDCFVNGNFFSEMEANFKNGEIIYDFTILDSGDYSVYFQMIKDSNIKSNTYSFSILQDEKNKPDKKEINTGDLDLNIKIVTGKDTICEVTKEKDGKYISIYICYDIELLDFLFTDIAESKAIEYKQNLLHPIALFSLFYKKYDELESEEKNTLMVSYIKSILSKI